MSYSTAELVLFQTSHAQSEALYEKTVGLSEIPVLVLTQVPGWCGPAGGIASASPQSCGAAAGGRVEPACSGEAVLTGSGSGAGAGEAWDGSLLLSAPSSPEETEGEPRHCLQANEEKQRKIEWEWVCSLLSNGLLWFMCNYSYQTWYRMCNYGNQTIYLPWFRMLWYCKAIMFNHNTTMMSFIYANMERLGAVTANRSEDSQVHVIHSKEHTLLLLHLNI